MASVKDLEDFVHIKQILRENPQGMTVTDIANALHRTKNTVGRYLDILHASGQVEMRTFGMAKVFTLAQRVPLSQFLSQVEEMVIILDQDFRILQVNDPFLHLLNKDREDVIGKNLGYLPVGDVGTQEMLDSLTSLIRRLEPAGEIEVQEGEGKFYWARVIPIFLEDGGEGYTAIIVDVTRMKQAERALRESERNYRELVEGANSVILKMDPVGTITFFNAFAEEFFGFPREEILGKNVVGTIVPPIESSGRDLREMIQRLCSHTEVNQINENENITRDGRRVWVRWTNRAIKDEQGKPIGVLSIGNDITEHRQLDEQFRMSEKRFRELADLLPLPIFEADASGVLTFANRQAFQTFGYTPEEARGVVRILDMIIPEDRPRAEASIARILNKGGQRREEYTALRKDGSRFPIVDYSAPIQRGDQIAGFRGVVLDLTAQKEAEKQLRLETEFINATLHTIDALVVVLDPQGRIERFNHACETLSGFSEKEVQGQPLEMFLLPEEREVVLSVFQDLLAKKTPVKFRNGWKTREGSPRLIEWSSTVLTDEMGVVTHIIGTGIDITAFQSMEQELRMSRAQQSFH